MVDTCKEAGVTFMAGHVMNFFNGVRHAKALIKAGEIGEVTQVHTKRNVLKMCRMRSHGRRFAQSQAGICTITFTS
ncbi:dehydrogenase-like protein [Salmonella enterica subsp. arizonae]|uniref:Dehydrogenase-like protein n=1 Tax=Salmonella enterica subsp. arizonae TaxID=59203 RepID=A0A2X4TZ68_SALER|nr:dehydrogenase-like protein [Salmonella enterica subsp. arizonae]